MDATFCTGDLLTTAQVSALTGRNAATVNRWAKSGRLPVAAQANGRIFRREDVERLRAELLAEAEAKLAVLREAPTDVAS